MKRNSRVDDKIIVRDKEIEKSLGIDDLKIYAYMAGETELRVICEVVSNRFIEPYYFQCIVYDNDGDVISTEINKGYGGGNGFSFVTSSINRKSFYNGIPVEFELDVPKRSKIGMIKLTPKK